MSPPVTTVVVGVGGTGTEAVGSLPRVVVMLAGAMVLVLPDDPYPAAVVVTPFDTCAVHFESVQQLCSPLTK